MRDFAQVWQEPQVVRRPRRLVPLERLEAILNNAEHSDDVVADLSALIVEFSKAPSDAV